MSKTLFYITDVLQETENLALGEKPIKTKSANSEQSHWFNKGMFCVLSALERVLMDDNEYGVIVAHIPEESGVSFDIDELTEYVFKREFI